MIYLEQYLSEIGKGICHAYIGSVKYYFKALLGSDDLDTKVNIGGQKVEVDGVSLLPAEVIALKSLEVETETDISFDKTNGKPVMGMSKGLFNRKTHVKIKAKFGSTGSLEAFEVLRNEGDRQLQDQLEKAVKPAKK